MNVLRSDRWLAGLLAGWAAFAIASIWLRPLWPVDETRYASVAWEMWLRGDFVVPYVNGEPYAHKPPLLFWLIHAGWLVFGVNDWWPRMVGPLCAAAAVPLIVRLERLLWPGGEARGLPVWVLFGSLLFAAFVTLTMFDLLLMLCAMVAVIGVVRAAQGERIAGFAWLGAGIALGVLAKGPVILVHVLPVALVAPWWAPATRASWRSWYAGILCALAGGAAIALAWAIPAALSGGPEYARAIFWGQTAGRVAESFAHRAPWWYYVPLLPVIFFPWLVWPALWRGARHAARSQAERFLGAWLVLVIVAFSLVSGKQAKYLVPLLPAFALLAGRVLAQPGLVARSRFIALPAVGFAVAGAALAYARLKAGAPGLPEWTAAIPWWPTAAFVAIAVTLAMLSRKPALAQVRALAFAVLAATVTLGAGVVPAIADYNDVTPVARRIAELQARGLTVAFFGKYHA